MTRLILTILYGCAITGAATASDAYVKSMTRVQSLEERARNEISLRGGALKHRTQPKKPKSSKKKKGGLKEQMKACRSIATRSLCANPTTFNEMFFACTILHIVAFTVLNLVGRAFDIIDVISFFNGIVFLMWQGARANEMILEWASNHFILNCDYQASETRPSGLLLSGFSHINKLHLSSNMAGLRAFGPLAANYLGLHGFIHLYIGGLVSASLASCLWPTVSSYFGVHEEKKSSCLGASGAISAVITFACLAYRGEKILIETPAWLGVLTTGKQLEMRLGAAGVCWALADTFGLFKLNVYYAKDGEDEPKIAYAAHLGGTAFGVLFFYADSFLSQNEMMKLFVNLISNPVKLLTFSIGCLASLVLAVFPDSILQKELQNRNYSRQRRRSNHNRR